MPGDLIQNVIHMMKKVKKISKKYVIDGNMCYNELYKTYKKRDIDEYRIHLHTNKQLYIFFNTVNLTFGCQVFLLPVCKLFERGEI